VEAVFQVVFFFFRTDYICGERKFHQSISGLVVEYIVAIDVTRVRFPADAFPHGAFLYAKTARIANANAQTGPPILL
jgi:hypothetical protein